MHTYIGINTVLAPLYISEISPVKYRGAFGALHQFTVTFTILLSQVLGINVVRKGERERERERERDRHNMLRNLIDNAFGVAKQWVCFDMLMSRA